MIDTLRISKSERRVLLYTFIIGLVAHGFMLFNKFSLNDDNDCLFRLGLTYPQGRWLIGILDDAFQALGTYNVSLPLFNGVLALLLIALSSCYICKVLNITDTKLQIILGALMETVIEVAAMLGFMFSAWCNALGILMSAVSALLCIRVYEKQLSRKYVIISCLLLCCSLGIYQAYFSFFICIVLIRLLLESSTRNITATSIVRESCLYCLTCVLAVACYLVINSAFLNIKGVSMTTYQGMDNWGMAGGACQYVTRIINAYVAFLLPQRFNVTIFPELIGKLYPIVLIIILLCLIALFRIAAQRKGSGVVNYVALAFFSLTLPLALNFHYILSDVSNIHSQMIHSSVFTYILIIAVCQQACNSNAFPSTGKIIKKHVGVLLAYHLRALCTR